MTTVQLAADLTDVHAQLREARELLEQIPEGLLQHFREMLFESVSAGCLEIGKTSLDATTPTTYRFRFRLGWRFDAVVAAMRAKQLEAG